ncbi:MAG: hypothetical protein WHV44_02860 [Anaerolineales bacterium]
MASLKLQDILPVVLSVFIIVLVAVLEKQSKLFAAITATMPLTIPLALWIVYSSTSGDQTAVTRFTQGLVLSLIPTFLFAVTTWAAARAGMKLLPIIVSGYIAWVLATGILVIFRKWFGL